MQPLQRWLERTGNFILIVLCIIPIILWIPYAVFGNTSSVLRSLGQLTALVGTTLFCLNYVLSSRARVLELFFPGLNRIYITHHIVGALGFILILLHPVFIITGYLTVSLEAAYALILPSANSFPVFLGMTALLVMIVLLFLTLYVKLEYDLWKKTHTWLGLPLFLAQAHVFLVGSTVTSDPLLRVYFIAVFAAGTAGYIFRQVTKLSKRGMYSYRVISVHVHNSVTFLSLKPEGKRMAFSPGQFTFMEATHRGIPRESHPFSIVSSPESDVILLAAKAVGEYTETLKLVEEDTPVLLEGPFGRFSYRYCLNPKQVWIGAGIGVTPFVSMVNSISDAEKRDIVFIYCVREPQETLFMDALKTKTQHLHNLRFIVWASSEKGRFNGSILYGLVDDVQSRDIFICGLQVMMQELKVQIRKLGVPQNRIHSEEFSLQ